MMRFWTNRLMVVLALVTGFIGALPVFGQSSVSWGGNTLGFDFVGRLECVFSSRMELMATFEYDDAGHLFSRNDAEGRCTRCFFDGMNRIDRIAYPDHSEATFDHDGYRNVIQHEEAKDTKVGFDYDEMNHLIASTQTVNSATAIVSHGFDLNGNRTNIVYPGGLTVGYVYGSNDRIEHVATMYGGNTKTFSFSYDTANRMTGISYPNGVNSIFGLDAEGRVSSIAHGNFINRTIQRNSLGFKETELIDAGLKPTTPATERIIKTNNDADQLISEQIQSGDNWTQISYGYNANGCLTNIMANGVETKKFGYNYDNMLTSVDSSAGSISYLYDALGARVGRIDGSVTHYFVIDERDALKRPLAETDAAGNIIRFYVWNGSQLLCHIDVNGTVRYYHADELGSTLALTDVSGNVTDQFAYMPYGYATHTGSTETPFQWLGGYGVYYDSDTDLHLTLHRAYSSKMKRFIHPDPLGIDGGPNVYVYANQNPLFFVDPTGEIPVWLITGGIGALIGGGIGFFGELLTGGDLQSASAAGLAGLAGGFAMGSGASLIAGAGLGTFATVGGLATLGATTEGLSNVGEQALDDRFHNRNVDINGNEVALASAFGTLAGLGDAGVEIGKRAVLRHIDDGYQMTKKYLNDIGQSYAAEGASRGTRDALLQPHYWRNAQLRDLSSDSVRRTADRLGTYYLPVMFGGLSAAQSLYSNGGGSLK